MDKQFLYIVDPLPSLNVKTDTTLALMEEAGVRGVGNFACEIKDIFLRDGKVHFMAARVELKPSYTSPPVYLEKPADRSVDDFTAVFMRKDPPVDETFLASLLMLRCHDPKKTQMINEPDGLLIANEKLFGQKMAAEFFPPTLVSSHRDVLEDFIEHHGRVVLKPLFKAGGSGVLVFDRGDLNLPSALDLLTSSFSMPVMAQEYIKNARAGDKRIILLGGQAIGAVTRIPSVGDHRANFHAGGSPQAAELTSRELQIVDALRPHLVELGLHFVGIDVIGGYLTEINVTSPTCLIEIERLSQPAGDQPLRAQVMDYIEELIA